MALRERPKEGGTRLDMPIKDIPMPIEVITREFIDDIGAVDIKEALQYSAGIVQDSVQSSNNFSFSPSGTGQNNGALTRDSVTVNIRGFNTRSFLRSGFRQDTVTDVINVSRQEIARGCVEIALAVGLVRGDGIGHLLARGADFRATGDEGRDAAEQDRQSASQTHGRIPDE